MAHFEFVDESMPLEEREKRFLEAARVMDPDANFEGVNVLLEREELEAALPFRNGNPAELDASMDRYLEALGRREAEIARNEAVADLRKKEIDWWCEHENARMEREARWLRHVLEVMGKAYDFGAKKSRNLPHGVFGFRRGKDRINVLDMALAVEAAEAAGLPIKKEVGKTELLELVKSTGEVPAGVELVSGEDAFYAKASVWS